MSDVLFHREDGGERLSLPDGSASALLVPRLGLALPRYHFHVGRVVHAAQELKLFRVQTTLLLGNDLTGEAELTEFTTADPLDAAASASAYGRLARAAQQRMQAAPGDFGEWLIAELPGWRDADGRSPFWQALGSRFYGGDPADAEARLGAAWRTHLAALLPRQTVYLSFLGAAAEAALGQAAPACQGRLDALREAGFELASHVRIDDGGPVLRWRPVPARV